jgi:hypothetical protein
MPGPRGIIMVKGSFKLSDLCDKEFHKMAQTFGMTAKYGQLNDKTESATITTTNVGGMTPGRVKRLERDKIRD